MAYHNLTGKIFFSMQNINRWHLRFGEIGVDPTKCCQGRLSNTQISSYYLLSCFKTPEVKTAQQGTQDAL